MTSDQEVSAGQQLRRDGDRGRRNEDQSKAHLGAPQRAIRE
jgi:hypothetical protein